MLKWDVEGTWRWHIRFGVEDIATDALSDGHAKVDKESYSRDTDSGIVLVGACQICCIVMVVVAMM